MIEDHIQKIDDPKAQENINSWLHGSFSESEKNAVQELVKRSPKEAVDAFYKKLEFGTAGIRGIVGVGTNRMNTFTIKSAAQALVNYMLKSGVNKTPSIMIGYDNRIHSREFAECAARVFAGNSIKVFLLEHLRPTPYLSFNMREKKCEAGCMITASHNPKEYNGFKVYWQDGGQVLPPHDAGIIHEFEMIKDPKDIKITDSLSNPLIEEIEDDSKYIEAINSLQCLPKIDHDHGDLLSIVYTSLHGTGITLLPELFKQWGFSRVTLVEEQCIPDGNFPTIKSPNPEDKEALKLGMEMMLDVGADILLATDPDADRVGVVALHQGSLHILNGNQIAALLADHVFSSIALNERSSCLKSIVTTELFRKIAENYHVSCFDVLPGFKYVAEKIREWEAYTPPLEFVLAAEESFGYLHGTKSRDKDALLASLLIAECALKAKLKGETLIDSLHHLYEKYGIFLEKQRTLAFQETKEGQESMKRAMEKILKSPPLTLHGKKAEKIGNLKEGFFTDLKSANQEKASLPKADMVILYYEGGQTLMIRPSGTEPKIKIYLMLQKPVEHPIDSAIKRLDQEAEEIFNELSQFLKS